MNLGRIDKLRLESYTIKVKNTILKFSYNSEVKMKVQTDAD